MGGRNPKSKGGGRGAAATAARLSGGEAVEAAASAPASAPWAVLSAQDAVQRAFEELAKGTERFAWTDDEGTAQGSRPGLVPIPILRDLLDRKVGRTISDAEFRRVIVDLDRSDKVRIVPTSLAFRFNARMRARLIKGIVSADGYVREYWGFLDRP